jgi:hypothetical protein
MKRDYRHTVARLYYFVTPVFILLDYLWGINVRVAVLDSMPLYKNLYYAFCIICAVGIFAFTKYSAVVALFESAINFVMTILVLFLPYARVLMYMDEVLNADWEAVLPFSPERIVNLFLAGLVAAFTLRKGLLTLQATFAPSEPTPDRSPDSDAGEAQPR